MLEKDQPMTLKLTEAEIQDIVNYLRTEQELPEAYRHMLFPGSESRGVIAARALQEDMLAATHQAGRILVVDDQDFNRMLLRDLLERDNHLITEAADGIEALEALRAAPYDLVLLDLMMPRMTGHEALQAIKADPALHDIPVIMVSANDELDNVVGCIQDGAEDYLPKPINVVLLGARVRASLTRKAFADQQKRYLEQIERERERSDRLLLNILPMPIAERLKAGQDTIADTFTDVTVLFADIVDFTETSSHLSAEELVAVLNQVFSLFDRLTSLHGLEKIKTVGDAYMVVGGLPHPHPDHLEAVADLALALREAIAQVVPTAQQPFRMRMGMHTGPVVAGVIGATKFSYDLWGDTVNTASRMENLSLPGQIQVTEEIYQRLADRYAFEPRGPIEVKGKGVLNTYFLVGRTA